MLIAYYTLKINIIQSILTVILSTVLFALIGTLILNPFLTLTNISSDYLNTIPLYRFSYLGIMYTLSYLIIILIKYRNFRISILDSLDCRSKRIVIGNLILGLFTLALQLVITIYYTDTLPIFITFLSFISLLSYFGISLYSLTRIMKLTLTTRKLQSAEEYNKTLRILHDSVRGFKHDFDNIVTTIGGYIRTDDLEGLKKYYVELEDDCQRVNNLYLLNPEIVNNPRYL